MRCVDRVGVLMVIGKWFIGIGDLSPQAAREQLDKRTAGSGNQVPRRMRVFIKQY